MHRSMNVVVRSMRHEAQVWRVSDREDRARVCGVCVCVCVCVLCVCVVCVCVCVCVCDVCVHARA